MEERIGFEQFLYGDGKEIVIDDMEFCVDRIIMLPKIRPHQLEKAVSLSIQYCQRAEFRRELLRRSFKCPALIYQLFKKGILVFDEIEPILKEKNYFVLYYYFMKDLKDFDILIRTKRIPDDIDKSFLKNTENIDKLIEYGFLPLSIEYCLKYDVIDVLQDMEIFNQKAKWSPFEWSNKPKYLDLLSFSGFFGSVKCFKHLLMNDFEINDHVLSMVVCSGCLDLFHFCRKQQPFTNEVFPESDKIFYLLPQYPRIREPFSIEDVLYATEFYQLPIIDYMMKKGVNIKASNQYNDFLYLIIILFIVPQKMVTFILLIF